MPAHYRYINQTTANGVELHILKTDASNIMFRDLEQERSLVDSIFFGVNGGFFGTGIINIAKCDGVNYGGQNNDNVGGGIITWNGSSLHCYTNSSMRNVSTVLSTNATGTWAQGGYSMFLGASDARERSLEEVNNTDPNHYLTYGSAGKTALVADLSTDTIYLFVARADDPNDDLITFTTLRRAIQYYLNIPEGTTPSSRYKGLMLDGGGSSQLRGKKTDGTIVTVRGEENRHLRQVIVMRDAT